MRAEHLGGAVGAERLAELVGQIIAADDDGVALAADLRGARGALGHGPERVLVELALVMQDVGQNVGHQWSPSGVRSDRERSLTDACKDAVSDACRT